MADHVDPPRSPRATPIAAKPARAASPARPSAYEKKLARAKQGKKLADTPSSGKFSLDLSSLAKPSGAPVEGEHTLADAPTLTTPRAQNEAAITVRGEPKHRQRALFKVGPEQLGSSPFKFAWRPGGQMLATASKRNGVLTLFLFRRDGTVQNQASLGAGKCIWLEWESKGQTLGLLQEGSGVFLWDMPAASSDEFTLPMGLCPSITQFASFCRWSKNSPLLAIGTQQGKVIIFNKAEGVMQLHEKNGKHGAAVTCGDWLFDNRLGLASGLRVKISQPISETGSKWTSFSKFRLGGMLSKVPRHIRAAGEPKALAFTLGFPPFVAVSIGDKYLLTFDTTRVNEDLGLTFPEDYGQIAGFQWLPNLVLLVGLTNGYIVAVDFGALIKLQQSHKLPDRVSAMGTTRVFNDYLQDLSAFYTNSTGQRVACCGDTAVKIIHRTGVDLEVHLEVALDRKPKVGEYLDKVEWDDSAKAFACSSTDGYLYVHELLD
ncbi:hypothetical protein AB1Y20_011004 [Prymnesium parvum]|uniref:WDR19 first beta-propeller domain-containing protein n=1 Tax=Prymnesium parvum TaxID=97485 RepID=A0AB34INP3_PRYPA